MKIRIALVASTALALAACGSAEDAATEAQADNVEIPANDALSGVDEEAVADEGAAMEEEAAETGVASEAEQAVIAEEADEAAAAAADVADALGEAADTADGMIDPGTPEAAGEDDM